MTTYTAICRDNIKTAAEYRADAEMYHQKRADSIENSDTDGFVSQWAFSQMASTAAWNASRIERGYVETEIVTDLDGKIVATVDDLREGQYGSFYVINDAAAAERVGRFVTLSRAKSEATRDANNAKKGIRAWLVRTSHMALDSKGSICADIEHIKLGHFEIVS